MSKSMWSRVSAWSKPPSSLFPSSQSGSWYTRMRHAKSGNEFHSADLYDGNPDTADGVDRSPRDAIATLEVSDIDIDIAKSKSTSTLSSGLSIEEKKILLVNSALDATGFGLYQKSIFLLCGFGYFLDLVWAQAFGLIATPLTQELNVGSGSSGNLETAFAAGLTVGAFTWGILVDIIGRRWAFNLTLLITATFGLLIGTPSNYSGICALAALTGFGLGGNIPIDSTIVMEFVPHSKRWVIVALSIFQPLGVISCSAILWGIIPPYSCDAALLSCRATGPEPGTPCCGRSNNMGWRYGMFTLGAITLFCFIVRFFLFKFEESPRYLINHGYDGAALESLHAIAKRNGKICNLSLEDFKALEEESGTPTQRNDDAERSVIKSKLTSLAHLKPLLTNPRQLFNTLVLFLIFMCDYWGFTIAGFFLPIILASKNAARHLSISETYRNYVLIALPGIPGVLLGALLIQHRRLGRKYSMFISACLMSIALFLFTVIDSEEANVGFNAMEYFFQSMFNAILYGYTPEAYPSIIRGTVFGTASMLGRFTSIVAPLIAQTLLKSSVDGVLYLAGGGVALAAILTLFLVETKGKHSL